jgi:hypothetical protein
MANKKDLPKIFEHSAKFVLTIRTNVAMDDVTDLQLIIKGPARRVVKQLTDANITNPTNGEISYTLTSEDLTPPGKYAVQVIDVTDGAFLPSAKVEFMVEATL